MTVVPKDQFAMMLEGAMARMGKERREAATNMRLGQFIDALAACDQSLPLVLDDGLGLGGFMSYRGYYEDLAIEPTATIQTVASTLAQARAALGEIFEGYKGGEYAMSKQTLLWVSLYGSADSRMLIGVEPQATEVIVTTTSEAA